jgi:hypothetical protein
MASYARVFINLSLVACMAWTPGAQAQIGPGTVMSTSVVAAVEVRQKNERDALKIQYLRGFASYVSAMVYAQSLDLKERIDCLYSPRNIQTSPTCYAFVYGEEGEPESELVTLLKAYLEMRKQLALATASSAFGGRPDAGLDRFGVPFQFQRNRQISHLFDKYRLNFISDLPPVPALAPLTTAELEGINRAISVQARNAVEFFYSSSGFNELPSQLEDLVAQERAQVQAEYDHSDQSIEAFMKWDEAQRALDRRVQEHVEEIVGTYRYVTLSEIHNEVSRGLAELANDSRLRYYQLIQQFPVLAFLKLDGQLIEKFMENGSFDGTLRAVGDAMNASLVVNQKYFQHLMGLQDDGLRQLLPLMEMAPLAEQYFDPEIHDMDIVQELIEANKWREIKEDMKTVAVGVAWGFTCGAILAWGYGKLISLGLSAAAALATQSAVTIQCALTSGLGLNAIFYASANKRYHRTFQQFFAVSAADKRERYQVLQEIGQLQQRDQEMLFESLFLFVGTGVGESVRRLLSPASQQTIFRWLQASGRD